MSARFDCLVAVIESGRAHQRMATEKEKFDIDQLSVEVEDPRKFPFFSRAGGGVPLDSRTARARLAYLQSLEVSFYP